MLGRFVSLGKKVFGLPQFEREMAEELRCHIAERTDHLVAQGMARKQAQRQARLEFGAVEAYKEECREVLGIRWLETLWQDVCYGARTLAKSPGFTAVAVLSLALGIGATSTIFSVLDRVVLRPLAFQEPDRLVVIREREPQGDRLRILTNATFLELRKQSRSFEQIAGAWVGSLSYTVSGAGGAERAFVQYVEPNVFPLLGVEAIWGRTFSSSQQEIEGQVVISHRYWQRRFGGDPAVISRTLPGRTDLVIVGVMPLGFRIFPWNNEVDFWESTDLRKWPPSDRLLTTLGRLKPGVSIEQAQRELDTLSRRVQPAGQAANTVWRVEAEPLGQYVSRYYTEALYLLLGAVTFVLLIACGNVAGLLLSRGTVRQKEMATRAALGAGRLRLVRQVLTESLVLALLGGALGVLLAYGGIQLFIALAPDFYPLSDQFGIDARGLVFTFGVALLTGILFGLTPALLTSNPNLNQSLKEGARRSSSASGQRLQRAFVVSQVALALTLLVGAGLMINSFLRLLRVDPGFKPDGLLTIEVRLDRPEYLERGMPSPWIEGPVRVVRRITPMTTLFFDTVLERVAALPGVVSVGMISALPTRGLYRFPFQVLDHLKAPPGEEPQTGYTEVSPNYFRTMGIPLLRGRFFTEQDRQGSSPVVIISETMARQYFVGEDPIGKLVQAKIQGRGAISKEEKPRQIVGVVGDVINRDLAREYMPIMYVPYRQHLSAYPAWSYNLHVNQSLVIRSSSEPKSLAAAVRSVVSEIDRGQPVHGIRTMEGRLAESIEPWRFWMRLLGLFAGLAVFLAAVGLYGVVSYSVTQKTHEFGLRMALGADRVNLLKYVLRQGLVLSLVGVALGVLFAVGLSHFIESQLFGVTPMDPLTFGLVSLLIVAVAVFASYLPARRATKIDPLEALRYE